MSTEQKPQTRDRSKTIIIILSAIIVLQAIKIFSDYNVKQTLETTTADLTETRTRLEEIKSELDQKIAEISKLVENTYRDVNVALANEVGLICEKYGVDVSELIKISNSHPRVNLLSPGPGVGGHVYQKIPIFC